MGAYTDVIDTLEDHIRALEETLKEIKAIADRKPQYAFAKIISSKCGTALSLQVQNRALPTPSKSPEAAVEATSTGGRASDANEDGQDQGSY